ncbi:MAG: hypothetical protein LBC53_06650 [Spirochaetaceae bacterium]|jgi:hypothetical protein|nr:hypothetical protein [Spirochaetaceae bacterium]
MNNGSATVNGDTVTLTKSVGVSKRLAVPAGVTLDMAGDSGLWLMNGKVNAPSNRIGWGRQRRKIDNHQRERDNQPEYQWAFI